MAGRFGRFNGNGWKIWKIDMAREMAVFKLFRNIVVPYNNMYLITQPTYFILTLLKLYPYTKLVK